MTTLVEFDVYLQAAIPESNQYQVSATCVTAQNCEREIFVFDAEHGTYLNVATPHDLQTWPRSRDAAQQANLRAFRAAGVSIVYPSLADASHFLEVTRSRVKQLAVNWAVVLDEFLLDTTEHIDSNIAP